MQNFTVFSELRRCYSSSIHSERHFTALLTQFKWKPTGMYLQSCEPGLCFLPLKLQGIRLYIFSCLKLAFGKPSEVNQHLWGLYWNDFFSHGRCVWLFTLLDMEVGDCLYLSADLHLCLCSQLSQLSTNVSIPVTGHHAGLDSLRFWAWKLLFCAPVSCSVAFFLLCCSISSWDLSLGLLSYGVVLSTYMATTSDRHRGIFQELGQPEWLPYMLF